MLSSAAPRLQRHGSERERGQGGPGERGNGGERSRRHGVASGRGREVDDGVLVERPLDSFFLLQLGPSLLLFLLFISSSISGISLRYLNILEKFANNCGASP